MKRYWFVIILVIGSSLLCASDMEKFLRNGIKHHFNKLSDKEIEIKNDQINLYDLGEHTYRINFDDSLNIEVIDFLNHNRFISYNDEDEIEFQVILTDSLDFFAIKNKVHRYPLKIYKHAARTHFTILSNITAKALYKAYERAIFLEQKGEMDDLENRLVSWKKNNNCIKFEFSRPSYFGGKVIIIDSITFEVIDKENLIGNTLWRIHNE